MLTKGRFTTTTFHSILEKSFGTIILGWWLKHASNNFRYIYSELNEYLKEWRNQHFYMVPSAKQTYTSSSRRDQMKVNHGNPLVQIYVCFPHLPPKSPWNPGSCCTSPHQKWHVHQKKTSQTPITQSLFPNLGTSGLAANSLNKGWCFSSAKMALPGIKPYLSKVSSISDGPWVGIWE